MRRVFIFGVLLFFLFAPQSWGIQSIEFLTGYIEAPLKSKDDYELLPLFLALNFDGSEFLSKIGIRNTKGEFCGVIEPFINPVISPRYNIEVGVNFLGKYTFSLSERVRPYIKAGVGVVYMSLHTREQGTQYNFLPQVGVGVSYFLNKKTALNFEYRYRHLSNASFKKPNAGIDAEIFLAGLEFVF